MMIERLPEELCLHVALYLSAQDVLKFLILHRNLVPLGNSVRLWTSLLARDCYSWPQHNQDDDRATAVEVVVDDSSNVVASNNNDNGRARTTTITAQEQKRMYLSCAHAAALETVRWRHPVQQDHTNNPSPREGHLMCVMNNGRTIVLTGGFCDDSRVHILNNDTSTSIRHRLRSSSSWTALHTIRPPPSFVYGATLTPIDERRAVQFGGFRAGGYTGESNQVAVLALVLPNKNDNDDDNNIQPTSVDWQTIVTDGPPPMARAYHSATLLQNRYLVIIGGMTTDGSILQEAILDTHTWTWLDQNVTTTPILSSDVDRRDRNNIKPTGRHGHSVVLDERRNRLVMFGGGSGSDLLRSGVDNTQVWELKITTTTGSTPSGSAAVAVNDIAASLPWTWNKIYKNAAHFADMQDEQREEETTGKESDLSPAECLTLGRCHIGIKVAPDMVIFAFGSGRPTTNGILAYNLATDTFHRPDVRGPLPIPRFSAAAAAIVDSGWLLIHGGYTTQVDHGTRGDTVLLDLAPGIRRRTLSSLPLLQDSDPDVLTYRRIEDADVHRRRQRVDIDRIFSLFAG